MTSKPFTSVDDTLEALQEGQKASLALSMIEDKILMIEGQVLSALVRDHVNGTLTDAQARTGIAEIAGLRRLVFNLTRVIKQSEQAAKSLE